MLIQNNLKIAVILLLFVSCFINPKLLKKEEFNFENSTVLARHQESLLILYKAGEKISNSEIKNLENNIWFRSASILAPGNLIIRQWCLIDILRERKYHEKEILSAMECLSYNGTVWAEGYSYWLYMRRILDEWLKKFSSDKISNLVRKIDINFIKTSYNRNGIWYPAPYGDIRNIPLDSSLQNYCINSYPDSFQTGIVKMKFTSPTIVIYSISAIPIGMNFHIPKKNTSIIITDGIPINFNWYEGYEYKYKNKEEEMIDLLDSARIKSIGICH